MATEKPFNLCKQCVDQKEETIVQVVPPYTAVELESGCRALADVIELPIYFERRQEYQVLREGRIVLPPRDVNRALCKVDITRADIVVYTCTRADISSVYMEK